MVPSSQGPALPPVDRPARAALCGAFRRGFVRDAPFSLVVIPFALLFGLVATEAGLTLFEAMIFSVPVSAGASQFIALQLMADKAPVLIVRATSLAVNPRMAMYSVALAPHLGAAALWRRALLSYAPVDQTFAVAIGEHDRAPLARKVASFAVPRRRSARCGMGPPWPGPRWVPQFRRASRRICGADRLSGDDRTGAAGGAASGASRCFGGGRAGAGLGALQRRPAAGGTGPAMATGAQMELWLHGQRG